MDFIRTYLCCCLPYASAQDHDREHAHPEHEIPNERTQLIPREGEEGGGYDAIDQQKLERRLGGIVRSKESKMVRIGYTHPFNLHNKDLTGSETTISRSNSNSGSSFVGHHQSHSQHHGHHQNHQGHQGYQNQGYGNNGHNQYGAHQGQNAYASSSEHVQTYGPARTHTSPLSHSHSRSPSPSRPHIHTNARSNQHPRSNPQSHSRSRSASRDPEDDTRASVPYADEQEVYYDEGVGQGRRGGPVIDVRLVRRSVAPVGVETGYVYGGAVYGPQTGYEEGQGGYGGGGEGGRGRRRERVGDPPNVGKQKADVVAPVGVGEEGDEAQTPTDVRPGVGLGLGVGGAGRTGETGEKEGKGEKEKEKEKGGWAVKKRTFVLDDVDSIAVSWGD